jgi:RNA polymerase sigma-70 factor (ECF subfamily)
MNAPSDEELMRSYTGGDLFALRTLFVRHARLLQVFFWCMLADVARAAELGQRAWLKLHHDRKSYVPPLPFLPWLYALAVQLRRDAARDAVVQASQPGAARAVTDAGSLVRALADLPDSYREVLVLHRLIGLSFGEIAQVLGATESAVTQRTHQGYSQLIELAKSDTASEASPSPDQAEQAGQAVFDPALFASAVDSESLEQSARALLPAAAATFKPARPAWAFLLTFFLLGLAGVFLWLHSLR